MREGGREGGKEGVIKGGREGIRCGICYINYVTLILTATVEPFFPTPLVSMMYIALSRLETEKTRVPAITRT